MQVFSPVLFPLEEIKDRMGMSLFSTLWKWAYLATLLLLSSWLIHKGYYYTCDLTQLAAAFKWETFVAASGLFFEITTMPKTFLSINVT